MSDPLTVAGWLLLVGPVIGLIPVANPSLMRIWMAPREEHLATVGAHRRAWAVLNAGFVVATVASASGLAILVLAPGGDPGRAPALVAVAVAYAVGGAMWCAVQAIRTRTTPALADLVAAGVPTEPAEGLLGAATGGLFGGFVLLTAGSLVALGLVLGVAGGVAAPVAGLVALSGLVFVAWFLRAGDLIPAFLYLPTMLVGIALLTGWT
jgi:hypothetical protein